MKRNIPIAAGAALLALSVAACSGASAPAGSAGQAGPAGSSQAGSAGFQEQHKGGTLRLQAKAGDGTLDPHINYSNGNWQVFQAMYDGLLAFKKVGGEASYDLVPDLAEAMPQVSQDGRSYTFTLRKGVRFAGGGEVTVDDVVASFERIYKVSGPTSGTFYAGIVGAEDCVKKPKGCTLEAGVVADKAKNTVTINLVEPDSEFPLKLALPHAAVLPKDTPDKDQGTKPIGGTGSTRRPPTTPTRSSSSSATPTSPSGRARRSRRGTRTRSSTPTASPPRPRSPLSRTARPTGSSTRCPPIGSARSAPSTPPRRT